MDMTIGKGTEQVPRSHCPSPHLVAPLLVSHLLLRHFHKPEDSLQVWPVDEGTHPCIFQKWISNFYPLGLFHHFLCKLIKNVLLHKYPCTITTNLKNRHKLYVSKGWKASPVAQQVKNLPAMQETQEARMSIPGSGRSPGGGNGNPLQYSCLGSPVGKGAWRATIPRVTKSQTWLNAA